MTRISATERWMRRRFHRDRDSLLAIRFLVSLQRERMLIQIPNRNKMAKAVISITRARPKTGLVGSGETMLEVGPPLTAS